MRRFNENPNRESRAVQIWQILVSKATNRQTMTYGMLAEILGFRGAGTIGQFLDPVMIYCRQNGLPPLTVVVVNQDSGLPGAGLPGTDLHVDRERTFNYDWFGLVPPTPEEFRAASNAGVHPEEQGGAEQA